MNGVKNLYAFTYTYRFFLLFSMAIAKKITDKQ